MKRDERDALLVRLDEKTNNIYTLTEKQEAHLAELNKSILNHAVQISSTKSSIKWLWRLIWITAIILLGGGGIVGIVRLFT